MRVCILPNVLRSFLMLTMTTARNSLLETTVHWRIPT